MMSVVPTIPLRVCVLMVGVLAAGCSVEQSVLGGAGGQNVPAGGLENTDALCSNGLDDDANRLLDCEDFSCLAEGITVCRQPEVGPTLCEDGFDNDADGLADCADEDCADHATCGESTNTLCSDGVDNDDNNFADCEDFSCLYGCTVDICDDPDELPPERRLELCR